MSNTQDTYEAALMAVEAALRIHAQQKNEAAQAVTNAKPYDRRESAFAIGEQSGAVDAYLIVTEMLNDYRKAVYA